LTNLSLHDDNDQSPFDSIRRYRADGSEYWEARELMIMMGYKKWERFENPINQAIENLEINGDIVADHFFPLAVKSAGRDASSYELTRYAAYMTALCCDGRKPEVAAAKKYFAMKARQAEIAESKPEPVAKALPTRDAFEYIQAADTLSKLPDSRLTRLLSQRLISELALADVNQRQITPVIEESKQWTTATVRAGQLGYSAAQINGGSALGKFVKAEIDPAFMDWQGQYKVNHFEVCDRLDDRIHAYFLSRDL
jgi:hypothetical protein